jgi:hypothetical protein
MERLFAQTACVLAVNPTQVYVYLTQECVNPTQVLTSTNPNVPLAQTASVLAEDLRTAIRAASGLTHDLVLVRE